MDPAVAVIGGGARVARQLASRWSGAAAPRWIARAGPLSWALDDGAGALAVHLRGADIALCLAGAQPSNGADLALNARLGEAAVTAAQAAGLRHVFLASSMAVYGDAPGPHPEDGPAAPGNAYGRSKLEMERAGAAARTGIGLTCLRIGNVVGADSLGLNIAAGRPIVLDQFEDGRTPRRSYLDPERLCLALERLFGAVRAGEALPRLLNLASRPALEMRAVAEAAGVAPTLRPAPPGARAEIAMDIERAVALVPGLADVPAAEAVAAWRRMEPVE